MSRCQHCKKLTHSEHLNVYFDISDIEKVHELQDLQNWTPKYMYSDTQINTSPSEELGKLRCGDIIIHFITRKERKEE